VTRWLLPVVLALAVPAFAQDVDAGSAKAGDAVAGNADAGSPEPELTAEQRAQLDDAAALAQAGDPSEALKKLDPLAKDAPKSAKVSTLRCVANVMLGETHAAQAVDACDAAAQLAPADTRVRLLLASSQESAGKLSDALESYRAVTLAPEGDAEEKESASRAVSRLDGTLHAGRHFAYLWDAEVLQPGTTQPQVWLTPRWGRVDSYTAVDLRAGVMQAVTRSASVGFFVDATPVSSGPSLDSSLTDARGTLVWHHAGRAFDNVLGAFDHVELGAGPFGVQLGALLGADAQYGAARVALNVEVTYDHHFTPDSVPPWHTRQMLGFQYEVTHAFAFGLEMINRVSWNGSDFRGMAFYFGPSVSYRGRHLWLALSLAPQVAAVKYTGDTSGVPLEVNDNERFSMRLTLGTVAP
jgi:hypothetical protein